MTTNATQTATSNMVHVSQRPPAQRVRVGRGADMTILTGRAAEVWDPEFREFLNNRFYNEAATDKPLLAKILRASSGGDIISTLDVLETAIFAVCAEHRRQERLREHEEEVAQRHATRIADREYLAAKLGAPEMTLRRLRFDCQGNTAKHLQKLGEYIAKLEKDSRERAA
jgi:hypothetical protein